jgi:TonB family protein
MMRPLLFALLCLLVIPRSFSQKIERYYTYQWHDTNATNARFYSLTEKTGSGWRRRNFYLHSLLPQMEGFYEDSACTIPSGRFLSWYPNRRPESAGAYSKGRKQGLWLRYYNNGMMEDSTVYEDGHPVGVRQSWHRNGYARDSAFHNQDGSGALITWFDNGYPAAAGRYTAGGRPFGKWAFFYRSGATSAFEMYDRNGSLQDKQYFDEGGNPLKDTTNKDSKAEFPGGPAAWASYLKQALHFPVNNPLPNGDQPVVVVEATINEEGKVTDAEVAIPFYPDFDKSALDAVRNSPDWIPAFEHNRPVKFTIRQPVTFNRVD